MTAQTDIWYTNFQQEVRNEERAQMFLSVETIINEINHNSTKIGQLKQAQKDSLLNSIVIRYRAVYGKASSSELQNKWREMSFKELVDLNNDYAEKTRSKHNTIVDEKNSITSILSFTSILSTLFNILGLTMILIYDVIAKEKK